MDQDVALGVTMTITQADIPFLRAAGRLGEYAVVYRTYRQQMGGGFGDQEKNPFAWGVLVYVDAEVARIYSARGLAREWTDLTRLEKWIRAQGFWYWWMRNDLEPLMDAIADDEADDADPLTSTVEPEQPATADPATDDVGKAENPASQMARVAGGDSDVVPLPTRLFRLVPKSGS
ncbi:MAG: hypothetical protein HQ483_13095 [Rhodospirillales bacterium]|nr:hypothetical protein [Rhodospirillales bacterium]